MSWKQHIHCTRFHQACLIFVPPECFERCFNHVKFQHLQSFNVEISAITLHWSQLRVEGSLMIPCFSSIGVAYCTQGQAADCSLRQSSCFFPQLVVGLKPTHWDRKEGIFFILNGKTHNDFYRTDEAYGPCAVKSAEYAVHILFICLCVVFFILQGNFTASPTTVTVCLATLRERGLLPPLLQSLLRYLFLFT